jgi:hypothetical protein
MQLGAIVTDMRTTVAINYVTEKIDPETRTPIVKSYDLEVLEENIGLETDLVIYGLDYPIVIKVVYKDNKPHLALRVIDMNNIQKVVFLEEL